jgi:large subunit ribosomal protein L23
MKEILKRPLVTEKMTMLQERRQYAFEVDTSANKVEIAHAVERKFNVSVESIRTLMLKGKAKSQLTRRGRFSGRTSHWKKAIVTLKEGEKIDFVENV